MRNLGNAAALLALVLTAIVLAETPPARALSVWIEARELGLLVAVGVVLAVGFTLFFAGILRLVMDRGEPLDHAGAEDVERSVRMAAQPVFSRTTSYRVVGVAAGRGGAESFSLRELKAACRSGAVWRDSEWRRRGSTALGALLLVVGLLGGGVVIGPPWIKGLLGGALCFALVRLAWGWRRA